MNRNLRKLSGIAQKEKRKIIGLMSGTSLDGLDIAFCEISGSGTGTKAELIQFTTKTYSDQVQKQLKRITSVETVDLKELCYRHRWLGVIHGRLIREALQDWHINPDDVDAIASHGQSIYHYPARDQQNIPEPLHTTLQIGDSDTIAAETGILTVGDFRQKHVAHGGEGAPMAALVDNLLFAHPSTPRLLLNIGGIANYTYIPEQAATGKRSFTTDTGPGNTLIDHLVQVYFKKPFDKDGKIAASGSIHSALLNNLKNDRWFDEDHSKSTGPEYFNTRWLTDIAEKSGFKPGDIPPADLIATVTEFSATTIAENIKKNVENFEQCVVYVSGGGAHNPVLIQGIKRNLGEKDILDFSELGFNADAKEALIFAVLANETLAGEGFELMSYDGQSKKINFGKISFPQ